MSEHRDSRRNEESNRLIVWYDNGCCQSGVGYTLGCAVEDSVGQGVELFITHFGIFGVKTSVLSIGVLNYLMIIPLAKQKIGMRELSLESLAVTADS